MLKLKKLNKFSLLVFWPVLFISLTILYWPSFKNFFFGDDFYLGILGRTNSLKEILNFFNIFTAHPEFPFYRPLGFQVFYWISFQIFKLNSSGYHLIIYLLFIFTVILVYLLTKKLFKDSVLSSLTTFFYAFSNSHFYRLYFIALAQEYILSVLYLLSLICYLKFRTEKTPRYYLLSIIFFIFALMTKETALTIPLILLLTDYFFIPKTKHIITWFRERFFSFLPMIFINIFYLACRFLYFGIAKSNEYRMIFNLKSTLNNLIWYLLWSIGIPDDYVNLKLFDKSYLLNPGFFTEFGKGGAITSVLFLIFMILLFISLKFLIEKIRTKKQTDSISLIKYSGLWFLITISLVAFFPFHKFSYSVTLPLYGIALLFSLLAKEMFKFSKIFYGLTLLIFLIANVSANNFAYNNHWVVKRAKIAQNIWQYLRMNYPKLMDHKMIYFYDYNYCLPRGNKQHFLSQEVADVLCDQSGLNFLYQANNIQSKFQYKDSLEDLNNQGIANRDLIFIPVEKFFYIK